MSDYGAGPGLLVPVYPVNMVVQPVPLVPARITPTVVATPVVLTPSTPIPTQPTYMPTPTVGPTHIPTVLRGMHEMPSRDGSAERAIHSTPSPQDYPHAAPSQLVAYTAPESRRVGVPEASKIPMTEARILPRTGEGPQTTDITGPFLIFILALVIVTLTGIWSAFDAIRNRPKGPRK